MTTTDEWLDVFRMAHELGLTALRRKKHVELRNLGFEPGDDVYILTPQKAKVFLEEALEIYD